MDVEQNAGAEWGHRRHSSGLSGIGRWLEWHELWSGGEAVYARASTVVAVHLQHARPHHRAIDRWLGAAPHDGQPNPHIAGLGAPGLRRLKRRSRTHEWVLQGVPLVHVGTSRHRHGLQAPDAQGLLNARAWRVERQVWRSSVQEFNQTRS